MDNVRFIRYFANISFFAFFLFWHTHSFAQQPNITVLRPLSNQELASADVPPIDQDSILRSAYLKLSTESLLNILDEENADLPPDLEITIKLFDDVEINIPLSDVRYETKNRKSVYNREIRLGTEFLLIFNSDKIIGDIYIQGRSYQLRHVGGDLQVAFELDTNTYQPEEEPTAPPAIDEDEFEINLKPSTEKKVIDILVAYTKTAESKSIGNITDEIELAVEQLNQSFKNSDIIHEVKLIATLAVDYSETGNIRMDRDRLQNPSDGYLDNVLDVRLEKKADLVALITESGSCGIAFIMETPSNTFSDYAVSVTKRSCAVGNKTFAHEIGHNFGARHDWHVDPTDLSPFDHNHGFLFIDKKWRTIMAYNAACKPNICNRLLRWSNPELEIDGIPSGIPSGEIDGANNKLTIDKTAQLVSSFF